MKTLLTLFTIVFAFCTSMFGEIPNILRPNASQEQEHRFSNYHSKPMILDGQRALVKRPYDVLKYDLMMDWVNPLQTALSGQPDHTFKGVNHITARCDSTGLQTIVLDASAMQIENVLASDLTTKLPFTMLAENSGFTIALPSPLSKGDTFSFSVYYTRTSQENRGLFLYPKGFFVGMGRNGDSVRTLAPIAYTMSEPADARFWMPCNDNPYDKAQFSIRLALPFSSNTEHNFTASSSIQGSPIINIVNTTRIYFWSDSTPISTYLVCVNASQFGLYRQWYNRTTNSLDSIPIDNYAWQEDIDETGTTSDKYNLRNSVVRLPEMIKVFSEKYIEYPFKNYGHTVVHPFYYGGMEHQSLTTVNRSWLHGLDESGFAHELMHQWTGDYVTCATWADIWLNEGGATFGEALWAEYKDGKLGYHNFLRNAKNGYMQREQPAVWGIPFENVFNYGTTYAKAGWVYSMLRYVVGDSLFFPTMRKYLNKYAFSYAETEDMLAVFEQEVSSPAVPIRTFFDQWLYKRGHPEYDVEFSTQEQSGQYLIKITLKQNQSGDNIPEVFVMPVNLTVKSADGKKQIFTVLNNQRRQEFEFITDFPVASAIVDENEDILCLRTSTALSVSESSDFNKSSLSPNPLSGNEISLHFFVLRNESLVKINLYDVTGRNIQNLYNTIVPAGKYTLNKECNIPNGMYYVRLSIDGADTMIPLTVIR